jgi:GNAT superfamily N-acetyltransferase
MSDPGGVSTIREATVADVDVILDQRRKMFAELGRPADETEREAMIGRARPFFEAGLGDGSYRGWFAEVDGRVVAGGGLVIARFPPGPFDPIPHRAWVFNIYTEPAFRRQGLARQIVETAIAWSQERGFGSLSLHASDYGRPLYELLGFKPTNEMRLMLADP